MKMICRFKKFEISFEQLFLSCWLPFTIFSAALKMVKASQHEKNSFGPEVLLFWNENSKWFVDLKKSRLVLNNCSFRVDFLLPFLALALKMVKASQHERNIFGRSRIALKFYYYRTKKWKNENWFVALKNSRLVLNNYSFHVEGRLTSFLLVKPIVKKVNNIGENVPM